MSHPETITRLLACCDAARKNVSVFRELIWALVFICDRHLPDKRTAPYFMSCLANNDAQTRILGLWGLRNIGELTDEAIETLLADRSKRVREEAAKCADWAGYERDFEWWTEEEL
ncbi:MAG: hypothetical protein R3C53_07150 [Pirellulaceae bacterium]